MGERLMNLGEMREQIFTIATDWGELGGEGERGRAGEFSSSTRRLLLLACCTFLFHPSQPVLSEQNSKRPTPPSFLLPPPFPPNVSHHDRMNVRNESPLSALPLSSSLVISQTVHPSTLCYFLRALTSLPALFRPPTLALCDEIV